MVIDYSTPEGKLRMRLGDTGDLPFLPSSVYTAVYSESGGNLNKSIITCGSMILAQLAFKTHRKMAQLEVFGRDAFLSYQAFLVMTVKDPAFMSYSPLPYSSVSENRLEQFREDWNKNYYNGTQSQSLALSADLSHNDGSRYGFSNGGY